MLTTIQHHIRQLSINQWSIKNDNLKHVLTTVYQDFQAITSNNVINSNEAAKAMYIVCQALVCNGICKNFSSSDTEEHEFFLLFKNTLQFIFEKAASDNTTVGEREWKIYKAMNSLLRELAPKQHDKTLNKIIENVFFNDKFVATFKQCIEKVSTRSSGTQCQILQDVFHHFYIDCQCIHNRLQSHLLHPILRCILSNLYLESFDNQADISSEFFLEVCPSYLLSNFENCTDEIVNLLCPSLITYFNLLCPSLITYFSEIIHRKPINGLVRYLEMLNLCATIESGRSHFTDNILENLFKILNLTMEVKSCTKVDSDDETKTMIVPFIDVKEKSLTATILTLLYNLTVSSVMLSIIKRLSVNLIGQWKPDHKQPKDIDKLALLCDAEEDTIRFPAQSLAALIVENIDRLAQPQQITASYIVYLTKTINGSSQTHNGIPLRSLIGNMKSIAQNRKVKQHLVENKGLPLLTKAACHEKFDVKTIQQPALDVIWTVSFNHKAAELWKSDERFVKQLKLLLNSNVRELEMVADGILWRLENEAQFRADKLNDAGGFTQVQNEAKTTEQDYTSYYVYVETNGVKCVRIRKNLTNEELEQIEEKRIEEGKEQRKSTSPYRYDLMISYSSDNKDLCHLIYECLMKTKKYNVWIDKEKMHGSLMERMAEAIEESEYVLVCMSSDYSKSQACQSEAEYAYRRKHRLIFVKVEMKYTPNSWLGLLLGNNYYIDFTKTNFDSAFKDLFTQIHRHRKIENVDYTILNSIMTPSLIDNAAAIIKKLQEKKASAAQVKQISGNVSTPSASSIISSTQASDSNLKDKDSRAASENDRLVPVRTITPTSLNNKPSPHSSSPSLSQNSILRSQNTSIITNDGSTERTDTATMAVSTAENANRPDIRDEDFDHAELFDTNIDTVDLYPDDFDFNCHSDESSDDDCDLYGKDRSSDVRTSKMSSRYSWSSISTDSATDKSEKDSSDEVDTDPEIRSVLEQSKKKQDHTNVHAKHRSYSSSPSATSSDVFWYQKKPIDEWTQQEVFKFLNEKNLSTMLVLFENDIIVNGKRLHELYSMLLPRSEEEFEILKKKITSSPTTKISVADYKRFQQELEKLIPPLENNESVICTVM